MKTNIEGLDIDIFTPQVKDKTMPFIVLNIDRNESGSVYSSVKEITMKDFVLIGINVPNWNDDLSPWPCDPVFKGTEGFQGKADAYLEKIGKILSVCTEKMKEIPLYPEYMAIAGYSLAGLFALYSAYRTDIFQRIVSCSGSMWYPGFLEYTKENRINENVQKIYLSLGDRESHTKNILMSSVEEKTEAIANDLSGITDVCYELNEGNHFKDPDLRTAKGIAHILNT